MIRTILLSWTLVSAGAVSAAVLPAPAGLTNIGVAAAVRGAVNAQAPGQPAGRVIGSGKPVYLNDHVTTGPDGRLQILLLDQTTFTLGPNSDMVLDEFVYDPASGAGKVSAQISNGVFRFVTGKVAQRKPSDMKVALPVGTIGIRGTIVAGRVDGKDADVMLVGPGPENDARERRGGITVSNAGGSTDVDASGYGVSIRGGGAPGGAYRFSSQLVNGILGPLTASASGPRPAGAPVQAAGVPGAASQASGESVASGGVTFQTTASNLVAQNNDAASFAAQQGGQSAVAGLGESLSTWDQILAIPSGTGQYNGTGNWVGVTGVASPTTISGVFDFVVNVNFGARTLGGFGSFLALSGGITNSANINTVNYGAFAGALPGGVQAAYVLQPADLSQLGTGSFVGSTIQFQNVGGKAGGGAALTMVYTDSSLGTTAVGATTANLTSGAVLPSTVRSTH